MSAGDGAAGGRRHAVGGRRAVAGRGAAPRHGGRGGRPAAGARARPARPLREGARREWHTSCSHRSGHCGSTIIV